MGAEREWGVRARPFPWVRLRRAKRSPQLARFRELLETPGIVPRALSALEGLIGAPITSTVLTLGDDLSTTLTSNTVAIRLTGAGPVPWWVVIEAELPLVASLVARVTRRPPPRAVTPRAVSAALAGSLAALIAAGVRRGGAPCTAAPVEPAGALGAGPVAVAGISAVVGGEATHVRAFFPEAFLSGTPLAFGERQLDAMASVPLALPVVAYRVVATVGEVARLSLGDIWLPGVAWRASTGPRRVWLCAATSERGLIADLEADGRVVLRDGVEELSWSPMSDDLTAITAVMEAVADVPVVVRAELGAATLTAREWSALRPGDVVGLGSRIGDLVTLRVSGAAIAEGELVDLDGEVGVRIRRRFQVTSS